MHPKYRANYLTATTEESSNKIYPTTQQLGHVNPAHLPHLAKNRLPTALTSYQHQDIHIPGLEPAFSYHPMQRPEPEQPSQPVPQHPSAQYSEDLEKLKRLKEAILFGQHPRYKPVPRPDALASLYLGSVKLEATGISDGSNMQSNGTTGHSSPPQAVRASSTKSLLHRIAPSDHPDISMAVDSNELKSADHSNGSPKQHLISGSGLRHTSKTETLPTSKYQSAIATAVASSTAANLRSLTQAPIPITVPSSLTLSATGEKAPEMGCAVMPLQNSSKVVSASAGLAPVVVEAQKPGRIAESKATPNLPSEQAPVSGAVLDVKTVPNLVTASAITSGDKPEECASPVASQEKPQQCIKEEEENATATFNTSASTDLPASDDSRLAPIMPIEPPAQVAASAPSNAAIPRAASVNGSTEQSPPTSVSIAQPPPLAAKPASVKTIDAVKSNQATLGTTSQQNISVVALSPENNPVSIKAVPSVGHGQTEKARYPEEPSSAEISNESSSGRPLAAPASSIQPQPVNKQRQGSTNTTTGPVRVEDSKIQVSPRSQGTQAIEKKNGPVASMMDNRKSIQRNRRPLHLEEQQRRASDPRWKEAGAFNGIPARYPPNFTSPDSVDGSRSHRGRPQVWDRERPLVGKRSSPPIDMLVPRIGYDARENWSHRPSRADTTPRSWEPSYRPQPRLLQRMSDYPEDEPEDSRYDPYFPVLHVERYSRMRSPSPMHRPGAPTRPLDDADDDRPSKRLRDDVKPNGFYPDDRDRRPFPVPFDYPPRPGSPGYSGIGGTLPPHELMGYAPRDMYDMSPIYGDDYRRFPPSR